MPSDPLSRAQGQTAEPTQPVASVALLTAARRLLRPLVRLMMKSGVTFPVLADALRQLFVDVAVKEILPDPRSRTDSRVSILSGVHRKEIKRLRALPADQADAPAVVTLASQVVARWLGSPAFSDPNGQPRVLARLAPPAGEATPSFEALVLSVTTDVRPRAVLDDLIDHGVVTLQDGDQVHLNTQAFIPRPGGMEQLFYFARNLHDHVAAASTNISTATPPFFDRSVHYDDLTPSQAEALRAFARDVGMRALLEVNRKALDLLQETTASDGSSVQEERQRVNLGIYVYQERDGVPQGET